MKQFPSGVVAEIVPLTFGLARYFAASLARVQLNATCLPPGDFLQICYSNPVPGNPIGRNRLYYRSLPERYTHLHRAAWLAKGYLLLKEGRDGEISATPKIASYGETLPWTTNRLSVDGVEIECDYLCASE